MLLNLSLSHTISFTSRCTKFLFIASISILLLSCEKKAETEIEEIIEQGDVTSEIKLLGNPLKTRYKDDTEKVYARNIWDMHAFGGKIYFGGGNSSNNPPAVNSGPVDLWTYNPITKEFKTEYTLPEEQIHLIREFDNQLYIPGHDSRESWDFGNFYRLESGVWKKYRTIPNGVHVYDIYKWDNKLIAAIGTGSIAATSIQVSTDDGKTWKNAICTDKNGNENVCSCYNRIYNVFPLSNKLFAYYYLYPFTLDAQKSSFNSPVNQSKTLFGGDVADRIERAVVFAGETVYITGNTVNDHQYLPLSLLHAKDIDNVSKVELPRGAVPYDLLVKGRYLLRLPHLKIRTQLFAM